MMDYNALLAQVLALLQQEKRLSYRVLKIRLRLDDDTLEALKEDLIPAKQLAVDEKGKVLVWLSHTGSLSASGPASALPPDIQADRARHGDSLPPELWAPAAERRQLTVLFCDVVDSAALASQLDPEEWREVVREGLGMMEAVEQLNPRLASERGVELAVRLGIHMCPVVVGEIGSGATHEQSALGETPNVAARLQGIAARNRVVISAAMMPLLGGFFACQSLGPHLLKGLPQPIEVYHVRAERTVRSRLEATGGTSLPPLVGREPEVALLWSG